MAEPLRIDDLPSFAGAAEELQERELADQWAVLVARVQVSMRAVAAGHGDRGLLREDFDELLRRISSQEVLLLGNYAAIEEELSSAAGLPDDIDELVRDARATAALTCEYRQKLLEMRQDSELFDAPPVVTHLEEGGVGINPALMVVERPYTYTFAGCTHAAVRREDGTVDFLVFRPVFEVKSGA